MRIKSHSAGASYLVYEDIVEPTLSGNLQLEPSSAVAQYFTPTANNWNVYLPNGGIPQERVIRNMSPTFSINVCNHTSGSLISVIPAGPMSVGFVRIPSDGNWQLA